MKTSYCLNGLIRLSVNAPRRYSSYFDNEYSRINVASENSLPIIRLKIGKPPPYLEKKVIQYKGLFNFKFAIEDLATDSPKVYFERHWLERIYLVPLCAFIQCQLVEPLMYMKLLENDVLFMHAAGVSKDEKAFIFPAHGGTGKTTRAISLIKQGYELMGDDLLMVDAISGTVYPYARPLHLFTYNLNSLKLPNRLKFVLYFKDFLRRFIQLTTGQRFLISTRVHIEELMPVKFSRPAKLKKITFLTRDEPRRLPPNAEAVETIIASADLNDSLFEYIVDTPDIRELERRVTAKVLAHVDEMEMVNPRH